MFKKAKAKSKLAEAQSAKTRAELFTKELVVKDLLKQKLKNMEKLFVKANKEYLDDNISDASEAAESYYAKREYESFSSRSYAPVWVRAETPEAWSVRITGLSYDMCSSIVSKKELGYQYAYMALNAGGTPLDPSFWDFPLISESERFSNKDMSVHENVKKLCEGIDPLHRSEAPAYTFQSNIDELNKKDSKVSAVGGCDVTDGVPSVRCMALNARVDGLPLQTLVLYWGESPDGDIDFDKCTYDDPNVYKLIST